MRIYKRNLETRLARELRDSGVPVGSDEVVDGDKVRLLIHLPKSYFCITLPIDVSVKDAIKLIYFELCRHGFKPSEVPF